MLFSLAYRCYQQQRPLSTKVIVHNDFHPQNLLIDPGGHLYLSDFENVTRERRWLLLDIVHYAVATETFEIDLPLIKAYLQQLRGLALARELDFAAQVRFALLKRLVQHLSSNAPPETVKRACEQFLREVVLPDASYRHWYEHNLVRSTQA